MKIQSRIMDHFFKRVHRKPVSLVSFSLFILIALIFAGCNSRQTTETTPTPPPDVTTQVSNTQATPIQLTSVARSTPVSIDETIIEINTSLFSHDYFSLQSPTGWTRNTGEHSATFTDPEEKSIIHVEVVNTGRPLDSQSFLKLINAREKLKASEYEVYVEIDRRPAPNANAHLVVKQISNLTDEYTLTSLYQQQEQAVLILDLLVEQESYEHYQDFLDKLISSVVINDDNISDLALYSFDQPLTLSNGVFSIIAPHYWSQKYNTELNSIVNTITSPDEQAVIQTIVYDDGQEMTKPVAGQLVLTLLREIYTQNIYVDSDQMLEDDREELIWRSKTDGYRGITTFGTRGTELYILTVMWSDDQGLIYEDLLKDVSDSYLLIESGK